MRKRLRKKLAVGEFYPRDTWIRFRGRRSGQIARKERLMSKYLQRSSWGREMRAAYEREITKLIVLGDSLKSPPDPAYGDTLALAL